MPHLVASVVGPIALASCADQIRIAHDYLARQGAQAIDRAWEAREVSGWGAAIKRIRVELPLDGRPELIAPGLSSHSLIEVINQCATMERLLDALAWSQSPASGFADTQVRVCHPTTSSAKRAGAMDNDLILERSGCVVARFEISDVASEEDGNQKERRDLISLGVLLKERGAAQFADAWSSERRFLVVSHEFARRLLRPTRAWLTGPLPHCIYQQHEITDGTRLVEVLPGNRPELIHGC